MPNTHEQIAALEREWDEASRWLNPLMQRRVAVDLHKRANQLRLALRVTYHDSTEQERELIADHLERLDDLIEDVLKVFGLTPQQVHSADPTPWRQPA